MKKNNILAAAGFAVLTVFSSTSISASTFSTYTSVYTEGPTLVDTVDSQGPVSTGSLQSTSIDVNGSSISGLGSPSASAVAFESGTSAVLAQGFYADGENFDLYAETFYSTSFTNNTAASIDFNYDFLIYGSSVELFDFAGINESAGLGAQAKASVFMYTDGGLTDEVSVFLELVGGDAGHSVTSIGGVANAFNTGGSFGYQMGDVYGTFSGSLAAGETVIIDSLMSVAIFGPGWELGARAFIGDPNDLSTTPGFSGGFTTASVSSVPVPAAAWLFGTGLLGLFGASRRRKL